MMQVTFISVLFVLAALSAFGVALAMVGGLQATRRAPTGILQYFFYFMFFGNALSMYFSGRNFGIEFGEFQIPGSTNPLSSWAIRLTSIVVMLGGADQLIRYFRNNPRIEAPRALLAFSFVIFWLTNQLLPSFLATHTMDFQLVWVYSLFLGSALICMPPAAADKTVEVCRNAIVLFCAVSLLLIVVAPNLVLDRLYNQGYIPGLPRFAGLAPHAILMGMNASIGVWCLLAAPMRSRWLQRAGLAICLLSLFLAQSKAVWIAFVLGLPIIFYYRDEKPWRLRKSFLQMNVFVGLAVGVLVLGCVAGLLALTAGGVLDRYADFARSSQGNQLLSFTGRDRIWEIAMQEFHRSPIFGYGLTIFNSEFRDQIHMSNATSGHNQFYDALARVGLVGTIGVSVYLLVLLVLGLRYARVTKGLSAVLALSIMLRTVSETPVSLGTIGIADIPHYLLLALLAAGAARSRLPQGRAGMAAAERA